MKGKPNISAFLEGAEAKQQPSKATKPKVAAAPTAEPAPRITKTIRLATDLETAIKEMAHERWKATGRKVSESDIIEEALRRYLNA